MQRLADLAVVHERRAVYLVVPDAGIHALADQLQVMFTDARRAGVPADEVEAEAAELTARFGMSAR